MCNLTFWRAIWIHEDLGILQNFTFGISPYQCGPALLFNGKGQMWQEGRKCFCSSWTFFSALGWVLLCFTGCDWVTWTRNRKSINTGWEYDCFLKGTNFNLLIFWRRRESYTHSVWGWHSDGHKWPSCHPMLTVTINDIAKYSPVAGLLMLHNTYIYKGQCSSARFLSL